MPTFVFYDRESGNDANDGLTSETAVATIDRVCALAKVLGGAILIEDLQHPGGKINPYLLNDEARADIVEDMVWIAWEQDRLAVDGGEGL